jgi:DNA replication protein DnaC
MSAVSISTSITATSARLGVMLTDLRLPTIKRLAGDLCAQSDNEGWPAHRLLEALLEHEINERESRRIDRQRVESGLSPDKRLSSFDFAAVPSVSKAQVMGSCTPNLCDQFMPAEQGAWACGCRDWGIGSRQLAAVGSG